ncbi:hypothetical protein ACFSSA_02305 [Luteolibacter algae]|uniref:HEAT repeat domain-containing protein n=1 Tax=Luteolibacter algae TaxID=454151 RepID=A0ABW5D684_9BACT
MKWNITSVAAACIVVGVAGFLAGKMTRGTVVKSEADLLIERSRVVMNQRGDSSDSRSATSARPIRPGSRSIATFEERLDNMEEIIRGENPLDRGRAMLSWIDSLAPDEFESAVERFRELGPTQNRMGEYAMLLTAWAELDPTAALAYTTEKTRGGMATGTVLTAWASRDPEAAIAWAKANHEGDEANPYMIGIIRGMVETDPARATELLQDLPFSGERGRALQAMIPHLMEMGTEGAKNWIAGLTDEKLRDGATARLAEEMAKKDPSGTAEWLLSNLGENSTRSVDEVFSEWAKTDKAAALDSFEKLPEGDARSRAFRGLVISDARENPQAAIALMDSYPQDVTDRTVQHVIWSSFDKNPDVAASQIGKIQDEGSRNRMYDRALNAWLSRDPAGAKTWINSANLPPDVVQKLDFGNQP